MYVKIVNYFGCWNIGKIMFLSLHKVSIQVLIWKVLYGITPIFNFERMAICILIKVKKFKTQQTLFNPTAESKIIACLRFPKMEALQHVVLSNRYENSFKNDVFFLSSQLLIVLGPLNNFVYIKCNVNFFRK